MGTINIRSMDNKGFTVNISAPNEKGELVDKTTYHPTPEEVLRIVGESMGVKVNYTGSAAEAGNAED